MLLDNINKANDIKNIDIEQMDVLADEIRGFLVENISKTGGHIASNLGVVELTIALHLALDMEKDQIVWDVGHQSYVHKILTGRKNDFSTLRQSGGLSGFPKRRESRYDAFGTGHSSTSISAALGLAEAAAKQGNDKTVVAVIGDGSLTGGLAFEGLNNLSKLKRNMIVVLNDNNMSIAKNVGGLSSYLSKVRAGESYNDFKAGILGRLERTPVVGEKLVKQIRKTKSSIKQLFIPGMLFENMGLTYLGPIDGHDVKSMLKIISEAKNLDHPVVIHVCTQKGRGYEPAELHPDVFHGIGPFDIESGEQPKKNGRPSYTSVFSDALVELAEKDDKVVAITAAMPSGTGLVKYEERFPDRFYDVGIAEEHAVTFAAGLATGGMKPFVAIYSSFLQRAFDQILHDVCMQNLNVTFCIDRAGLVGNDGESHQGIFDYSYLSLIPNMNIFAPKNAWELKEAIFFASEFNGPLAIRYPRGESFDGLKEFNEPIVFGKSEMIYLEDHIAIIACGSMVETGARVREALKEKGARASLVNARFVKPLDEEMIAEIAKHHDVIVTIEENVYAGGYGQTVLDYMNKEFEDIKVINIAVPNRFVEQGSHSEQIKECDLDTESILKTIYNELG